MVNTPRTRCRTFAVPALFLAALLLVSVTSLRAPGRVAWAANAPAVTGLDTNSGLTAADSVFPGHIQLPDGFRPEGIAVGRGHTFFAGSLGNGSIYRGDLRTGEGAVLVTPPEGRVAVGLSVDNNEQVFVAGGPTGQAYVYDGTTGAEVAVLDLNPAGGSFINDVVATRSAAWFTDSFRPVLYRVPIGSDGTVGAPEVVPLGGDYVHQPGAFNANGIDATPDGGALIIVQTVTGLLFRVEPATGHADAIDLGGNTLPNGDGILLHGKTLYVVQNRLNQVAQVDLATDLLSGSVSEVLTSSDFSIPTTVAEFGSSLYAVNARFGVPPGPGTEYWVTRLDR